MAGWLGEGGDRIGLGLSQSDHAQCSGPVVSASFSIATVTRHQIADSDEVAWAIRDDLARGYEMMSPGFGASLARVFLGLAGWPSIASRC